MDFHFQAKRAGGGQVSSRISARDYAEARSMLESRGFRDIELTKVDSVSESSTSSAGPSGVLVFRVVLVCVVGLVGLVYALSNIGQGNRETTELTESGLPPKKDRGMISTLLSDDPFDPERVRQTFLHHIDLEDTLLVVPLSEDDILAQYYGDEIGYWIEPHTVSIRQSTEIGYDYDVEVTCKRLNSPRPQNGRWGTVDVSSPTYCSVTFHVTNYYRISSHVLVEDMFEYHVEYLRERLRRLGSE